MKLRALLDPGFFFPYRFPVNTMIDRNDLARHYPVLSNDYTRREVLVGAAVLVASAAGLQGGRPVAEIDRMSQRATRRDVLRGTSACVATAALTALPVAHISNS